MSQSIKFVWMMFETHNPITNERVYRAQLVEENKALMMWFVDAGKPTSIPVKKNNFNSEEGW